MKSEVELDISRVANTLLDQALLFQCTLSEAWEKYMHPFITNSFSYEEVRVFIDKKIELGERFKRHMEELE